MIKPMLNNWLSYCEGKQRTREMRLVFGSTIMRTGTAVLLLLGAFGSYSAPAQAVPIKNPENCSGPVTIGVATCPDKPGHWVECNPSGDYMCCVSNAQGGKDCEQIEAFKNPKGGAVRIPGGVLQNAPVASPPSSPPRFPKGGMNAPIMRRGVEGDQPDNSTVDPSTAPQTK